MADRPVDPFEREQGARLFYSVYSFEIFLSEITGRPPAVSIDNVTISTDILFDSQEPVYSTATTDIGTSPINTGQLRADFQSTQNKTLQNVFQPINPQWNIRTIRQTISPKHFPYRARLCKISHRISSELYSGVSRFTESAVEDKINYFETELREWRQELPDELNTQNVRATDYDARPTIELAMYYHSVQMILYCRPLSDPWAPSESDSSQHFNNYSARSCVFAAMDMLALLSNGPTEQECYRLLPWWGSIHYLCQAAAALVLELCLNVRHFRRSDASMIFRGLWKALSYLRCFADRSLSAYKAWRIFQHLALDICAHYDDFSTAEISEVGYRPRGWTELDEVHLVKALTY
jgi:hypothetical protein